MNVSPPSPPPTVDLLLPAEMARACEAVGVRKARMDLISTAVLSGLAGAFIAMGAMLFTVIMTSSNLGYGPTRLVGGIGFSLGLILVILTGGELFTGNTLIVMAWASRKVSTLLVLRNWLIVYAGNFGGAILTVALVWSAHQWEFNSSRIGASALTIAVSKVNLGFGEAIALGILCNVLVALAVWLSLGARTLTEKAAAIVFPIAAFVAAGFEHSIANIYFIPMGLLVKDEPSVVAAADIAPDRLANLTWSNFLVDNLLPVTIGNIIGGALLVGAVYWFVFLRNAQRPSP